MNKLHFSDLIDVYGGMLTERQLAAAKQYYHLDYSLAEIAENEGVSRQAVHASLRQAQSTLTDLENKLGFCARDGRIRALLQQSGSDSGKEQLQEILASIDKLIG